MPPHACCIYKFYHIAEATKDNPCIFWFNFSLVLQVRNIIPVSLVLSLGFVQSVQF